MAWLESLKKRWKVKSLWQVIIILIVFACTGLTVLFLKKPLFRFLFNDQLLPAWATIIYYVLVLPVYNLLLLLYGFLFGQFSFFWSFEKRFFKRIVSLIQKK